jgi:chemosensory pili system protein ChpC
VRGPMRCMLLPLAENPLLLPAAAVAEITGARALYAPPTAPLWLAGELSWRGFSLPVVSLESVAGALAPEVGPHTRVAVLHGVGCRREPFLAIVIAGPPRLVDVRPELLEARPVPPGRHVLWPVTLEHSPAFIADLQALERLLTRATG